MAVIESSPLVVEQPQRYFTDAIHASDVSDASSQPPGPITIRNLRDVKEDCDLAGRLTVEAKRGEYVHATSEGSIPDMIRYSSLEHHHQQPIFYQRNFVAEYNGQPVGVLALKFHNDPEKRSLDESELVTVGCYDACGLACMGSSTEETVAEGSCYVDHVAVEEKFRSKGVGTCLMERAQYEAKSNGSKVIYLHLTSSNRSKGFFVKNSYVVKDRRCCCVWCATGACMKIRMEKLL